MIISKKSIYGKFSFRKRLKISKGKSEAVHRKAHKYNCQKKTKRQTIVHNKQQRKLKIEQQKARKYSFIGRISSNIFVCFFYWHFPLCCFIYFSYFFFFAFCFLFFFNLRCLFFSQIINKKIHFIPLISPLKKRT